jgi:hypothetical protein
VACGGEATSRRDAVRIVPAPESPSWPPCTEQAFWPDPEHDFGEVAQDGPADAPQEAFPAPAGQLFTEAFAAHDFAASDSAPPMLAAARFCSVA